MCVGVSRHLSRLALLIACHVPRFPWLYPPVSVTMTHMTIYFAADLHLGHPRVAKARGFNSVTAHDAAVMSALYTLNPDTDELYLLGDLAVGDPMPALDALSRLHLPVHCVLGNHDSAHSSHPYADEWRELYEAVFETVTEHTSVTLGGRTVSLSHFPFAGTPDRYSRVDWSRWQVTDDGATLLIHGHTHSCDPVSGPRSVCVSLDAWNIKPASERDVMTTFAAGG